MAKVSPQTHVRWTASVLAGVLAAVAAPAGPSQEPARPAELDYPLSIAVAPSGVLYLADRNLPGILRLRDGELTVVFHASKKFRTPLNAVRCVAVDASGTPLVGDSSTRDIYRLDDQGQPHSLTRTSAGPPDDGAKSTSPPTKSPLGTIGIPMDIAVTSSGELYVSDLELHRIVRVPKEGGDPVPFVSIPAPRGLCCDKSDHLWVISGRQLVKVAPDGKTTTVVSEGVFSFPHSVAVAEDGVAFVCDGYAAAIWKVAPGKAPEKLVNGSPLVQPVGMRLAGDALFLADPRARAVFRVSLDGKVTTLRQEAARTP